MIDYSQLTLDDLILRNQQLMAERERIKYEQREIAKAIEQKLIQAEVKRKLESFTEAERKALAQEIQAQGIKSKEQVGEKSFWKKLFGR